MKIVRIRPDHDPKPEPQKQSEPFEFRDAVYFTILSVVGVVVVSTILLLVVRHLL